MKREYITKCLNEHVLELRFKAGASLKCTTSPVLVPLDWTLKENEVLDTNTCEILTINFDNIEGLTILDTIQVDLN